MPPKTPQTTKTIQKKTPNINQEAAASSEQQLVTEGHLKAAQDFIAQNSQLAPILKFIACVFFHHETFANQAHNTVETLLELPRGRIFDQKIDSMDIDQRKKFYQDFRKKIVEFDKVLNPTQYKIVKPLTKTVKERLQAQSDAKQGIVHYSEETKNRINQVINQVLQELSKSDSKIEADQKYSDNVKAIIGFQHSLAFLPQDEFNKIFGKKIKIELGKKDVLPQNPPRSGAVEFMAKKSSANLFEYIILSRQLMREKKGLHDILRVAAILYNKFSDKSNFINEIDSQFQSIFQFEKEYGEIKKFLKDIEGSKKAVEIFAQFKDEIFELYEEISEVNKEEDKDLIIMKILEDVAKLNELGYSPVLLTDPELLKNPTMIIGKDGVGVDFIYEGGLEDNGEFTSGILTTARVSYFAGKFKDNKPCEGRSIFPNGDIYEGQIDEEGVFNGNGAYYFVNGNYKKGEFKDGKLLSGVGKFMFLEGGNEDSKGMLHYEGEFKNDQPYKGTIFFKDGDAIEASVEDGVWIWGKQIDTKPKDLALEDQPEQLAQANIAADSALASELLATSQIDLANIEPAEASRVVPNILDKLTEIVDSKDFFKDEFRELWWKLFKEKPEDFEQHIAKFTKKALKALEPKDESLKDESLLEAIEDLAEFLLKKHQEKTGLNPKDSQEDQSQQKLPDSSPATPTADTALPKQEFATKSK